MNELDQRSYLAVLQVYNDCLLYTSLSLMDAQARDTWYRSLEYDNFPAISEANILSTFEQLHQNIDEVFARGVINVFRGLNWNYKTNCPCKFGRKLIVNNLVRWDRWG